jgi:hypothetical protein
MRLFAPRVLAFLAILFLLPGLPLARGAEVAGPVPVPPPAMEGSPPGSGLPQAAQPVLLRLRGPASAVPVGASVVVDLLLENVDPLFGADLTVTYDAALLEPESVTPGPLFPDGSRYVMRLEAPAAGRVRYLSTLLGDATPMASTGVLASLRFRTLGWGRAEVGWDEAAIKLSDRESGPLAWRVEGTAVEVPTPTATPRPSGGGGGGGGSEPRPTSTPKPTSTPEPTREPTPTRTPRPTSTPRATPAAPGTPGAANPGLTPGAVPVTVPGNPLFPEPTLGPTVPVWLPPEPPAGVPPVTGEGVLGILGPQPGVGVLRGVVGDSVAEFRVDDQGSALAVRFQPGNRLPPGIDPPPGGVVVRVFSFDLYGYDAQTSSGVRIGPGDDRGSAAIVLKWRLGAEDYSRTLDLDGNAHPGRFVFYRISPAGDLVKIETAWTPDPAPHGTLTALFVDHSTFLLVLLPPEEEGRTVPEDPRYFRETGFRVGTDAFWDYFRKRGGVGSFGYPISRPFLLEGFPVQLFQRALLQLMPDGGVATMNLLEEGLLPYTRINSSSFPPPDEGLIAAAPRPSDPGYAERAVAFVQANVPDQWGGLPVGFRGGFFSRVRLEDAFPGGGGDPALLPLLNLEMWGLPTSRPARDPANHNFVYQRFQRGIMHYDVATGATEGLLLGDYLKSLMTGVDLPPDLEAEAAGSRFYRQYEPGRPGHLARGWELPATGLAGAFEMDVPLEQPSHPVPEVAP